MNDDVEPSADETPNNDELADADMDQVVGGSSLRAARGESAKPYEPRSNLTQPDEREFDPIPIGALPMAFARDSVNLSSLTR